MKVSKFRQYGRLFASIFYISSLSFGGGYVVIPMIRKQFVEKHKLFTEEELLDMAAIAQSSPGAIAVNLSALSGYRCLGPGGALISCLAAVLPPLIILSVISSFYAEFRDNTVISAVLKGMESGIGAIILSMVFDMARLIFKERIPTLSLLMPLAFAGSFFFNINAAYLIGGACIFCLCKGLWQEHGGTLS